MIRSPLLRAAMQARRRPATGGGSSYSAETTALLAQMSVQPSTAQADKIEALIAALKARALDYDGGTAWSHVKRCNWPGLHDRQAGKLDFKAPSTAGKQLLEEGSLGLDRASGLQYQRRAGGQSPEHPGGRERLVYQRGRGERRDRAPGPV
jgi:hypothetical protein